MRRATTRTSGPLGSPTTPLGTRPGVCVPAGTTGRDWTPLGMATPDTLGTLTAAERTEYEMCVRVIGFSGVLQAKARAVLAAEVTD